MGSFIIKNMKKTGQNIKLLEIRKKMLKFINKLCYNIKAVFKKGARSQIKT